MVSKDVQQTTPESVLSVGISVVIPCYNEVKNVGELCKKLLPVLDRIGRPFEILFVDDGSTDGTFDAIAKLHEKDNRIRVIRFRTNF